MKAWLRLLTLTSVLISTSAWSVPFVEVGDVGQSLIGAQAIGGGVNVIDGNLVRDNADLYSFYWGGGALTVDTFGSTADTQLFLFNSTGLGVWANDEAPGVFSSSIIIAPALAAGNYFVGVSVWDYDPYSAAGVMFPSAPFTGQFGPSNLSPLDHWSRFSFHQSNEGHYLVNFSTATTSVSEPSAVALIGALFALVAGLSRRLKKQAN